MRTRRAWGLGIAVLAFLTSGLTSGCTADERDIASATGQVTDPATGQVTDPTTSIDASDFTKIPGPDAVPPPNAPTGVPPSGPPSVTAEEFPQFAGTVSPVTAGRLGASYRPGCPVLPDALRLLNLSYVTFEGRSATGELVVSAEVAEDVVAVFAELYARRFPIRSLVTVDAFGADDDASMAADNTSAFNCRPITGGGGWSLHSYGVAIDLNPRENPYVSGETVLPPEGRDYLDRDNAVPGMIRAGDPVVAAFGDHGFGWGEYWTGPTDYQHFER